MCNSFDYLVVYIMIDVHLLKPCCYICEHSDLDIYDSNTSDTDGPIFKKTSPVVWCTKWNECFKYNKELIRKAISESDE